MAGLWDTAEMLLAIADDGNGAAAAAAAQAMAADCRRSGRGEEAEFWQQVAAAVLIIANPQPLIAPRLPPAASASVHRADFAARLPRERKRLLLIKEKLRAIIDPDARPGDKPERDR